jgi:hypothetical protein
LDFREYRREGVNQIPQSYGNNEREQQGLPDDEEVQDQNDSEGGYSETGYFHLT